MQLFEGTSIPSGKPAGNSLQTAFFDFLGGSHFIIGGRAKIRLCRASGDRTFLRFRGGLWGGFSGSGGVLAVSVGESSIGWIASVAASSDSGLARLAGWRARRRADKCGLGAVAKASGFGVVWGP